MNYNKKTKQLNKDYKHWNNNKHSQLEKIHSILYYSYELHSNGFCAVYFLRRRSR